jgi:hypothetical protein
MSRAAAWAGLLFGVTFGCSVQAAEHCSFRAAAGQDLWIASGEADTCHVKRVVTPGNECRIWIDGMHGFQGFNCRGRLNGQWGASGLGFQGASLSMMGTNRRVKLPEHTQLRKTWLAPIDREGLEKSYPIRMDDYIDYYPRRFTGIGNKVALENPDFKAATQTLRYTTMNGQKRVAVTGEAKLDCLRLYFYTWVEPAEADATERDMSVFLKSLRLEPVTEASPRRERVCQRQN